MQQVSKSHAGAGIDYELFLDCVHCGLCTASCPTYLELGTEMDSPRGRIYLMRAVVDGRIELDQVVRRHLDLCLDCRACESACPSGVHYGELIEPFRADMLQRCPPALPFWLRGLLHYVLPYPRRARWALWPARTLLALGWDRFLRRLKLWSKLPQTIRDMLALVPRQRVKRPPLPELLPSRGPKRARVALVTGCVNSVLFHDVNWATAYVLQANGCEVVIPRGQGCCGALDYHSGRVRAAAEHARRLLQTIPVNDVDAIVCNVAGCGSTLKEYARLLADGPAPDRAGTRFADKVRDVHEFLMELGPVPPSYPLALRATYHDACHLCHAQRIRRQPRQLLRLIPGLELVELDESEICCGAAGSYNLAQPAMAARLGQRKADRILATQAQAVFAANAGCLLQIARYVCEQRPDVWVAHPVEALWAAYSGERPPVASTQGTQATRSQR
ncbi:MAG: hypothetical protein C4297_13145 [Gemmataceae bacterium]